MKESLLNHLFQEDLYHFSHPVIIVLPRPWNTYTPEDHALLHKILTAVKVNVDMVKMIVQPSLDLTKLTIFSPERVLVFGSEGEEGIALYQETPAQGFTVIRAEDLHQLDEQKKKNLWAGLRKMFGV